MKKFLSLVLAVIMTMSLVTISASAAEYDDFTDKDEIKYEEAVAVLNKLGIITGYSEGDFRPEGELTRGAAAKIIVSLLIGPEAANNVSPTSAPYKDVPLDHTFAGVIAYCKTAGIISGYSDGSFQPGGTLTGYAFSKMLLGALGYKSDVERFTGAGWNMNVNARAAEAGLFDRISFKGNEPVNREEAAQLALNTLKATMVEYTGGFTVNAGEASVTGAQTRSYKVSNQEFASHINNKKAGGAGSNTNYDKDNWYTVEFGEEHFVDLRMIADGSTIDEFGRPSNEWSYKKVTIGTFPLEPDFTFTTQVINSNGVNVTPAQIERALGLSNYDYKSDANNGSIPGRVYLNGRRVADLTDVADIAKYTDNGTLVEVYVDEDDADWIRYVAVSQSQLMEVDRIGSDYVALDRVEADTNHDGFNALNIDKPVNNVEEEDEAYAVVKELKVGDKVVVIPVAEDHDSNSYQVSRAYVPETSKGKLTAIERFSDTTKENSDTVEVTVGGTKYPVSNWNKDLTGITRDALKITVGDVTLTLDEYGNAMRAEDVGETSDFMIVGSYSRGIVNSREVTIVEGWDIAGNEVSLNLGNSAGTIATSAEANHKPGDLVRYTNATNSNTAEWKLDDIGVYDVLQDTTVGNPTNYATTDNSVKAINANDQRIKLHNFKYKTTGNADDQALNADVLCTTTNQPYADKGIVFIYVSFNEDSEVDSVEVVKGMQNVTWGEVRSYWDINGSPIGIGHTTVDTYAGDIGTNCDGYNPAQACVKLKDGDAYKDGGVKAVVIKSDSSSVGTRNILYVRSQTTTSAKDENGNVLNGYTVAMLGDDGTRTQETVIYSTAKLQAGDFARWTKKADGDRNDVYDLHQIDTEKMSTSSVRAYITGSANIYGANKEIVKLNQNGATYGSTRARYTGWGRVTVNPDISTIGNLDDQNTINTKNAFWVDMIDKGGIKDAEDLQNLMKSVADGGKNWDNFQVAFVFNDNKTNDNFRSVAMIVVEDQQAALATKEFVNVTVGAPAGKNLSIAGQTINGGMSASIAIEKGQSVTGEFSAAATNTYKATLTNGSKGITATLTDATHIKITAAADAATGETVTITDAAIPTVAITLTSDDGSVLKFFKNNRPFTGPETIDVPEDEVELVYTLSVASGFSNLTATSDDDPDTQAWIIDNELHILVTDTCDATNGVTVDVSGTAAPRDITVRLNGTEKTISSDKQISKIAGIDTTGFILKSANGTSGWEVVEPTATVDEDAYYVDKVKKVTLCADTTIANGATDATGALGAYSVAQTVKTGVENTAYFTVGTDLYLKEDAVISVKFTLTTALDNTKSGKADTITVALSNATNFTLTPTNGQKSFTEGTDDMTSNSGQPAENEVTIKANATCDKQEHVISWTVTNNATWP